jgi:hypothetical protein
VFETLTLIVQERLERWDWVTIDPTTGKLIKVPDDFDYMSGVWFGRMVFGVEEGQVALAWTRYERG